MFGNTTIGAFVPNKAVGVFAVNTAQLQVSGGNVVISYVTSGGSGYSSNGTVTFTATSGGTSAAANAQVAGGRVTAINITAGGSGYNAPPTLAISAPSTINITANTTGFSNTTDTLVVSVANSKFQVGDALTYTVPTNNTAIAGLTSGTTYYVSFANTTRIALSATSGGANIDITDARTTASGEVHTIQGTTATGYVDTNSVLPQVTHAGWVLRTEGTGGRAGRIQYETLVAMGSLGETDGKYGTAASISSNTVDQYV
jgi:hypothetical protein